MEKESRERESPYLVLAPSPSRASYVRSIAGPRPGQADSPNQQKKGVASTKKRGERLAQSILMFTGEVGRGCRDDAAGSVSRTLSHSVTQSLTHSFSQLVSQSVSQSVSQLVS